MDKKKDTSVLKAIRLKDKVVKAVEKLAEEDNRNFSNMVETMLLDQLKMKGMLK
jgi:hypothetical protein